MWSDHENPVFETQFIVQNWVFIKTQDVCKIYTFKTVPTNYIVRKMGLIPNFGLMQAPLFHFVSWDKIHEALSFWMI